MAHGTDGKMRNVVAIILGGGRGARLLPLTKYRSKPAVPIAGKYRLIDIPISNCLNSGFNKIYVLTQFLSESLNKHISRAYKLDSYSGGFVEVIAAELSMERTDWFQGTADAVRQSLKHFSDPRYEHFFILSGDQLYALDLREVLKTHQELEAEVTVCCKPISSRLAGQLGIMRTDQNRRIVDFVEKPQDPEQIKRLSFDQNGEQKVLASMGIYLFQKNVLWDLLLRSNKSDFGREIIPEAIQDRRVFAHLFEGYWVDIGTIEAFYEANLALTSAHPPLNLYDEDWPFYTRGRSLPVSKINGCSIEQSMVADGSLLEKAAIRQSIIGLRSVVGTGTVIEESIVMGNDYFESEKGGRPQEIPSLGIGKECRIRKAIVDKNVRIGDNVQILNKKGVAHEEGKGYMIQNGIVVIEKNAVIPSGTII